MEKCTYGPDSRAARREVGVAAMGRLAGMEESDENDDGSDGEEADNQAFRAASGAEREI